MARDSESGEGKSKLKFFKNAKAQADEPAPSAGEPAGEAAVATAVADEASVGTPDAAAEAAAAAQAEPSQPDFSQPEIPIVRKRLAKRERPHASMNLRDVFAATLALAVRALVILAVIAAGAVAAALVVSKVIGPMVAKAQVAEVKKQIEQITITAGPEGSKEVAKAGGGGEKAKAKAKGGHGGGGAATEIKDLVVNPAGTDGTRYVCATVSLEASTPQAAEEVSARESQVRDRLIEILGARTVGELSSLKVRDDLREEIRESVDELITQGEIEAVYFSNFVLQ